MLASMVRFNLRLLAGTATVFFMQSVVAGAQQPPAVGLPAAAPQAQPGAKPAKPAAKDAAATAGSGSFASGPGAAGDAALRKRVEQLEEQLVDLQVVIGTLESLAKAPRGSAAEFRAPSSGGGAGDDARFDIIETQIRALTQQMEQLTAEVRGGGRPAAALPSGSGTFQPNAAVMPPAAGAQARSAAQPSGDAIGGILASEPLAPVDGTAGPLASLGDPSGEDPKQVYETAYGFMLQQNYGAAQSGFGDFLKRFPQHGLVPNALYWLGETYYVQKNFTNAAEAFDLVLVAHGSSNKAPDSQLKKAMSLAQLGKNPDACSALRQLAAKFPNAPSHVKTKADSERRRVGCP
jgi:tol-pal system protein YbgF